MQFKTYITLMIKLLNKNEYIYFKNKLRLISFLSLQNITINNYMYIG